MKISFSTLACPDWTLARVIEAASRLGYDGIELRFIEGSDALWERPELVGDGLSESLTRLRDAGLSVSCVDTSSFFHHKEMVARQAAADDAARAIDLAARLHAPGIRVFGDRIQPGADRASTQGFIAEALARLGEKARPTGVEVWIESHGDFARAADTLAILNLVPDERIGVLWDAANAFECGEDPADGLRVLRSKVRHVHLKDLARRADGSFRPVMAGQGQFPFDRALSALGGQGYSGWVSLEWEKKWHPELEPAEVALPHFLSFLIRQMREVTKDVGHVRTMERAWLAVEVHPDRTGAGQAAARIVSSHIRAVVERDGDAAVILASAPSQNEFLTALRFDHDMPWERITAFHLDEYVGVDAAHPASFRRFLNDRLLAHVPIRAFHGLDGCAADLVTECARYAALLRAERPSLVVLGIGENGHLAFVDPPFCDFDDPADVRVVELDEVCRGQQVHDGGFAHIEDVPRTALSLTIPFLMRVPRAVAIVPGPAKRQAVRAALDGPVTTACPASILRRHRNARLFLDRESAALSSER